MTIIATKDFARAIFTWDEELTNCSHSALGVSDKDFDLLIKSKVHEGSDLKGWNIEIN